MVLPDQRANVPGMLRSIALDGVVERREDVVRLDLASLAPGLCGGAGLRYGVAVMFLLG
jgi:hypothetical protein